MEGASPAFEAAERFVEATIGAALVPLWMLALSAHLAQPYFRRVRGRFGLRLAAEMWTTVSAVARNFLLLQVFLASFIFFYPDVATAQDLPITGGLAAALAFAVLVLRLTDPAALRGRAFRLQAVLIGLGAALYVVPYILGTQLTEISHPIGPIGREMTSALLGAHNRVAALALCSLSQAIVGFLGLVAVTYVLRVGPCRADSRAATAVSETAS